MIKREKIRLVNGKPLICAFDSLRGKAVRSPATGHVEYLYNVQHRGAPAMIFLPTEGVQALQRVQAQIGEDLHPQDVCERSTAADQHPKNEGWNAGDSCATTDAAAKRAGRDWYRAPQSFTQPKPDRFPKYLRQPSPPPPSHEVSASLLLATCLHGAIDAVIGAERFAASKGRELIFLSDDIRAMAITIYIGKQKDGRS